MKPKTKKVVKHILVMILIMIVNQRFEIKLNKVMKKAKIVNLRNLKKRLKTVKKNPPKSKKIVKNLVKIIIKKLKKQL